MPRTEGATNIQRVEDRESIPTTSRSDIRHLATEGSEAPLREFEMLVRNQTNYLRWLDSRHDELLAAKKQLNPKNRGPKDQIYRKYRWYAEQQCLLEAINAFEVFYKRTFIAISRILNAYIPVSQISGSVDARVLWSSVDTVSVTALLFEHRLFHDLKEVDKVCRMLLQKPRYEASRPRSQNEGRVRALQAVFQVRHTLSHNQGHVTHSDSTKLAVLGYYATASEVVDPQEDQFGEAVRRLLKSEATDFTDFVLKAIVEILRSASERGVLPSALRQEIENGLGPHVDLQGLDWQSEEVT